MKGSKEDVKRQKHSQTSEEGCVPSSQDSHPSSSPSCVCYFCGRRYPEKDCSIVMVGTMYRHLCNEC